jgi:hypothetical protein
MLRVAIERDRKLNAEGRRGKKEFERARLKKLISENFFSLPLRPLR